MNFSNLGLKSKGFPSLIHKAENLDALRRYIATFYATPLEGVRVKGETITLYGVAVRSARVVGMRFEAAPPRT